LADPKRDETFKVIDRRLFTDQGELRKDAVEQERREDEAEAKREAIRSHANDVSNASATKSQSQVQPGIARDQAPTAATASQPNAAAGEASESSRGFQMLVDFLTRNAAAMLGGMADPNTGQAFVDLEGAREVIDMIDALREMTRGNLSKADEDLLIEVTGGLKLTFMEVSRAATEAMAKKAKGKG
jgi:hypothetical protein